ncbi:MAG: STAS domain-containing protein, partial [Acinetobacter sp.]|nr:STAS domain-containing protein [Acinetobacter sp.]
LGVLTGVLLSALFLANKLENDIRIETSFEDQARLYELRGQIFFSSSEKFMQGFNFKEKVKEVIIDLTHSHIWDVTSVAMLDSVVNKFQKNGIQVTVRGLNEASSIMIDKYGTHAKI